MERKGPILDAGDKAWFMQENYLGNRTRESLVQRLTNMLDGAEVHFRIGLLLEKAIVK